MSLKTAVCVGFIVIILICLFTFKSCLIYLPKCMDIPSLKLPIYAANKLLAPLYWLLVVIKCLIKFSPPPKKNFFFF